MKKISVPTSWLPIFFACDDEMRDVALAGSVRDSPEINAAAEDLSLEKWGAGNPGISSPRDILIEVDGRITAPVKGGQTGIGGRLRATTTHRMKTVRADKAGIAESAVRDLFQNGDIKIARSDRKVIGNEVDFCCYSLPGAHLRLGDHKLRTGFPGCAAGQREFRGRRPGAIRVHRICSGKRRLEAGILARKSGVGLTVTEPENVPTPSNLKMPTSETANWPPRPMFVDA